MTVAVLGAPRPPAKTQWPSASSCSLKASIAAISSAVPESVLSSSTESRYSAIGFISCRHVAAPSGRLSQLLRTAPPRSDTCSSNSKRSRRAFTRLVMVELVHHCMSLAASDEVAVDRNCRHECNNEAHEKTPPEQGVSQSRGNRARNEQDER